MRKTLLRLRLDAADLLSEYSPLPKLWPIWAHALTYFAILAAAFVLGWCLGG